MIRLERLRGLGRKLILYVNLNNETGTLEHTRKGGKSIRRDPFLVSIYQNYSISNSTSNYVLLGRATSDFKRLKSEFELETL